MHRGAIVRSLIIISLTVVLGCVLTSCGKSEKTKKANRENRDRDIERLMKTMAKPNQEAIALLSLKYNLQPGMVESFLDSYLTATDMEYSLLKNSLKPSNGETSEFNAMELLGLEKESYSQALEKASQSVGITIKTAALLVSDYRMFTASGKSGSGHGGNESE
jgi:hypothetical protein